MRIIVCGGRDYTDQAAAFNALDRAHQHRTIALVIHGAARGADTLAGEWAAARGIKCQPCPADWGKHGRRAGPLRNTHMLTLQPDGVIALPGGKGTEDMVAQAIGAGLPVWRPYG